MPFSLTSLIAPLGAATLCAVSLAFLSGLLRRKLGRKFLKIHLALGIVAICLGVTHGILVFVLFN